MSSPSIETVDLSRSFGSFTALNSLNLKLEGPKCVGFLGPNGAGKTVTLKLLTDMIFPTGGECFIDGISVQNERTEALADVGALIESPGIYPSLTPRQALEMVADLRGLSSRERSGRIGEILAEVKMEKWADSRVGRFSKGMKQRINLAAALVHDPGVVILDEPATGLDPRGMAEVRDIIRNLKKRNCLVFMSSHMLPEVTDVCDEVALIDKGKLLFYDSLPNVIARFADSDPILEATLARPLASETSLKDVAALPGVTACVLREPTRLRMRFSGGPEAREGLLQSLVSLRIGILSLGQPESVLEEIYLSQVTKGD